MRTDCVKWTKSRGSYLSLKVSHWLIKGLWRRPLVVTQNSNCSVSPVVGQQFFGHTVLLFGKWQNSHLYLNRGLQLRKRDRNFAETLTHKRMCAHEHSYRMVVFYSFVLISIVFIHSFWGPHSTLLKEKKSVCRLVLNGMSEMRRSETLLSLNENLSQRQPVELW